MGMGHERETQGLLQVDADGYNSAEEGYDSDGCASSSKPLLSEMDKRKEMFKSYANIVCTMAGTGILQLPYTLKQGGWTMSALLVGCCCMATYTGKLVIYNLYRPGGIRLKGYPETGEAAFGKKGRIAVHVFHKGTVLGVSTLFLILAAQLLRQSWGNLGFGSNPSVKMWTIICSFLVAPPTLLLADVDALSFTSALGGIVTILVVLGVAILGLSDDSSSAVKGGHTMIDVQNFPVAFSTVILSFGGHSCFPTIQHSMATIGVGKRRFTRVLDFSFLTLLAFYLPTAVIGYAVYGDQVESPILSSLPSTGVAGNFNTALKLFMVVNVLLTFPILQHVMIAEAEGNLGLLRDDGRYMTSGDVPQIAKRFGIRFCLLFTSAIIAYFVPYFADMMSLVGALCVMMMVFIFPCVFAIKLNEDDRTEPLTRNDYLWFAWLGLIIITGLIGGGIGAEQAMKQLYDDIKNGTDPDDQS
eukprot:TRINITY_DN2838_c1_g1_i1.p1 TRINITY_DN2838_c1_g1~~TRINITY_DN2838_c1_g1_i1.p1  ORF type:complete len:471 (+),score=104.78 TRINITY_DN2838_c1_g1_i1:53-1465(+)